MRLLRCAHCAAPPWPCSTPPENKEEEDLQLRSRRGSLADLAKKVVRVSRTSMFSKDAAHGGAKLAKRQLELTRKQHLTGKVGAACGCWLELLQHAFAAPAGRLGAAAALSAASQSVGSLSCCSC
jgi:hypothetical protein